MNHPRFAWPDPPLRDGRVTLRPWRLDDAPALVAAWHDRDIVAMGSVPPNPTIAYARSWIASSDARLAAGVAIDLVIAVSPTTTSNAIGGGDDTVLGGDNTVLGGDDTVFGGENTVLGGENTVVGEVGVAISPAGANQGEIGYWVAATHRGHKVASAAVCLFVDWLMARDGAGLRRVAAQVDEHNAASVRVLERARFVHVATRDDDVATYLREACENLAIDGGAAPSVG